MQFTPGRPPAPTVGSACRCWEPAPYPLTEMATAKVQLGIHAQRSPPFSREGSVGCACNARPVRRAHLRRCARTRRSPQDDGSSALCHMCADVGRPHSAVTIPRHRRTRRAALSYNSRRCAACSHPGGRQMWRSLSSTSRSQRRRRRRRASRCDTTPRRSYLCRCPKSIGTPSCAARGGQRRVGHGGESGTAGTGGAQKCSMPAGPQKCSMPAAASGRSAGSCGEGSMGDGRRTARPPHAARPPPPAPRIYTAATPARFSACS